MSYQKYLKEHEQKIHSDLIPSSDDYMYSTAKAMEIYGQGKRFKIEDNLLFYEVIKIVKDTIDRHTYAQQVQFYIQIANGAVEFTFILDKIDAKYSYFVETLFMFICSQIYRQFGTYFSIARSDRELDNNKVELKIIVSKNKDKDN